MGIEPYSQPEYTLMYSRSSRPLGRLMATLGLLWVLPWSLLGGCGEDTVGEVPPEVYPIPDMEIAVTPLVALSALSTNSSVTQFHWKLIACPDRDLAALYPRGKRNEFADLLTASQPGLYLVAVWASTADGTVSDNEYINITLFSE